MSKPPRDHTSFGSDTYFITTTTWGGRSLFQTDRMALLLLDTLFDPSMFTAPNYLTDAGRQRTTLHYIQFANYGSFPGAPLASSITALDYDPFGRKLGPRRRFLGGIAKRGEQFRLGYAHRLGDPRARRDIAGHDGHRKAARLGKQHRLPAVEPLGYRGEFVFEGHALARHGKAPGRGEVPEPAAQAARMHW